MIKNGSTQADKAFKPIKIILITQPRPEGEKSPYFDLAKKYGLNLDFHPFIVVEGIPAKDFRKQKIDIGSYSAVIFTSRNAIDHFFRMCYEMKVTVSQETKYFCITEAVAGGWAHRQRQRVLSGDDLPDSGARQRSPGPGRG